MALRRHVNERRKLYYDVHCVVPRAEAIWLAGCHHLVYYRLELLLFKKTEYSGVILRGKSTYILLHGNGILLFSRAVCMTSKVDVLCIRDDARYFEI